MTPIEMQDAWAAFRRAAGAFGAFAPEEMIVDFPGVEIGAIHDAVNAAEASAAARNVDGPVAVEGFGVRTQSVRDCDCAEVEDWDAGDDVPGTHRRVRVEFGSGRTCARFDLHTEHDGSSPRAFWSVAIRDGVAFSSPEEMESAASSWRRRIAAASMRAT